jgi:endonuclease/exonuclease/phosphatase family metal-dependent hydrolase
MMRILTYNILVGGTERLEQLTTLIRSTHPDVVGLAEATDADVVVELAKRLNMQFRLTGEGTGRHDWHVALLSRLPIIESTIHQRPGIFTRRHFLEVTVEGTDGKPLMLYVVHLTSQARPGQRSILVRRAETRELVRTMASHKETPHLVMGDFNSIASGDTLQVSNLARRYVHRLEHNRARDASLHIGQRALRTAVRTIVNSRGGSYLLDTIGPSYGKGGIDLLLNAGYVDCFRQLHPYEHGYTFPSSIPSLRIDYIFASPDLAASLVSCEVISEGEGVSGEEASDHLPVLAEFNS